MAQTFDDELTREIARRLRDYKAADAAAQRAELIALWRAAYPEAAAEAPSVKLRPLIQTIKGKPDSLEDYEEWTNDVYLCTVRRWTSDRVFGTRDGMIQIGISSLDGTARHDWRDFQNIKNQLAGSECEAFELYPAESRLLDPSNYYTLWCFPGVKHIKVGGGQRRVFNADEAMSPQRAFAK